jgi:hypothetical protein
MIPEFTKTGTEVAIIVGVIWSQVVTSPRVRSQLITGAGSVDTEIAVRILRFFAIPILAPPGVSLVQKYPY